MAFRSVWARKWLVLFVFVVVSAGGIAITLLLPPLYTAETSLIFEVRTDPALGAIAPALAAPSYMATQIEILKSEPVASRAVKLLGVERSPAAVAQWREATKANIPIDRYFAEVLQRGLSVEQAHVSNVINLSFSAVDPIFAQAAANAFAQAYMDISVELRIAPARQSATFLDGQAKALRANLEQAQARVSKLQRDKGIVDHDQMAVYQLDIDTERRAYEAVTQRLSLLKLEVQNNQSNARLLSSAVEPLKPSLPKIPIGILCSLAGGLLASLLMSFALVMRDRRVRGVLVNKQRALCLLVIVMIAGMAAYPPFNLQREAGVFSLGHAWLFNPPVAGIVDAALLLTQWVGVLIVGGIALLLLKDRS